LVFSSSLRDVIDGAVPLSEDAWRFRYPGEAHEPRVSEAETTLAPAEKLDRAVLACLPEATRPKKRLAGRPTCPSGYRPLAPAKPDQAGKQSPALPFHRHAGTMVGMGNDARHGFSPRCFAFACCAVVVGCGGDGSGGAPPDLPGTGTSGATFQQLHDVNCAWISQCGRGSCIPQTCNVPILRANAVAAAIQCYETLSCEGSDDDCELAAWEQVPSAEADIESCLQSYHGSCPEYSDIDESLCLVYPLLIPSAQAEFRRCFESATCAEPCLQTVSALCSS
jgi:hypothetical protein